MLYFFIKFDTYLLAILPMIFFTSRWPRCAMIKGKRS